MDIREMDIGEMDIDDPAFDDCDYKRSEKFTLKGWRTYARVVNCHDGDTVNVVMPLNIDATRLFRLRCRLQGIDAPELPSVEGYDCRSALVSMLTDTSVRADPGFRDEEYFSQTKAMVWLECGDFDKYGRLLAVLYKSRHQTVSMNEILVREGFAEKA